jgi:hypothetical protein
MYRPWLQSQVSSWVGTYGRKPTLVLLSFLCALKFVLLDYLYSSICSEVGILIRILSIEHRLHQINVRLKLQYVFDLGVPTQSLHILLWVRHFLNASKASHLYLYNTNPCKFPVYKYKRLSLTKHFSLSKCNGQSEGRQHVWLLNALFFSQIYMPMLFVRCTTIFLQETNWRTK